MDCHEGVGVEGKEPGVCGSLVSAKGSFVFVSFDGAAVFFAFGGECAEAVGGEEFGCGLVYYVFLLLAGEWGVFEACGDDLVGAEF